MNHREEFHKAMAVALYWRINYEIASTEPETRPTKEILLKTMLDALSNVITNAHDNIVIMEYYKQMFLV